MSANDIVNLQAVGKDAQAARQQFILKDDQELVWKHLSSLEAGRVDFVLDNSGFELFTDLVFADFLLTYTPYVSTVYFHPKLIPWFVSDVTPPDFRKAFTSLLDPSFFPALVGDSSAPPSEYLIHMVARWKKYMEQGLINLSVPSDSSLGDRSPAAEFWTMPWPYWNMKHHAPELFHTLEKSDLVIFKGDLNYRKLVGDVRWPAWTSFKTAIGPLAGSFPLLSLRTNKADVVVGIEKEIAEALDSNDEKWRVDGSLLGTYRGGYKCHGLQATKHPLMQLGLVTLLSAFLALSSAVTVHEHESSDGQRHVDVLILGGGVSGVIAARTFHEQGIDNFLVIEARDELGGRLRSTTFGGKIIELGANWIQGTQTGNGPANPILTLAKKHNLKTQFNDLYGSLTTYDKSGTVNYLDVVNTSLDAFVNHTIQSGGFSEDNLLSIDQRGFKAFIQEEAKTFLKPAQLRLNSTVQSISWSGSGVTVALKDGTQISANYALCTFSLGVLQNDDVHFIPKLPEYKLEAIASMTMATYTKIFLKFPRKFWFDTEMALYADPERGRYPVWQSLDHQQFLPGSGIIFVTVTGDYSKRIEALTDSQVKAEVLDVLQSMHPNITIPTPLDFYFPRWHSDPLYRGSYSNWPPSFVKQHYNNLRTNVDRLYFAGEATSIKYYGE
ncbi:hypothetical protein C0992_003762 [Termitomyces sp. T32_za158]|nr:hypothetical protein C0992_003762 [Termitomyces sp. T32_za158]